MKSASPLKRQGENLIFLISQPRAGSTMLQRILGSHSEIETVSEPWLMLHPFVALRADGYEAADYRSKDAQKALQNFLRNLPDGEADYLEGVRRMYAFLYQRALEKLVLTASREGSRKPYFLDKTPAYYLIIPELYRTFPQARYIILLRNPLAVLSSLYAKWAHHDLLKLYEAKVRLIDAPPLLLEGIKLLGQQAIVVHYEQFVAEPTQEAKRLCERLEVDFEPRMIEYGQHKLPEWLHGDQKVYDYTQPKAENASHWLTAIKDDVQLWRLTHDYLTLLGPKTIEQLGYSYHDLQQQLERERPRRLSLTFSLPWLLKKPAQERMRWQHDFVKLIHSLHQRGIRSTMNAAVDTLRVRRLRALREETS